MHKQSLSNRVAIVTIFFFFFGFDNVGCDVSEMSTTKFLKILQLHRNLLDEAKKKKKNQRIPGHSLNKKEKKKTLFFQPKYFKIKLFASHFQHVIFLFGKKKKKKD